MKNEDVSPGIIVYLMLDGRKFLVFEETAPTFWALKDEDGLFEEYNCIEFTTDDPNDYDPPHKRKSPNTW